MSKAKKIIAVYRIINLRSGTFYIGSSTNLYERWRTHRKKLRAGTHPNPQLQASWTKHGEQVFSFDIIAYFDDVSDMLAAEEGLIDAHIDDKKCCNITRQVSPPTRPTGAAHHNYGVPMSTAIKSKLRAATLRQWDTSDPRTGRSHSDETKALISAKVQAALAEGRGGHFIPSEETRAKMSEALKGNKCALGYKRTDAEKEAIANRMRGNRNFLGKTHSEESRNKMGRSVVATAPDGSEIEYTTITKLRLALNVTPPTVDRALKSGEPLAKGRLKGWSFRYA